MKLNEFIRSLTMIAAFAATTLLISCAKDTSTSSASPEQPQGGVDGGGGDILQSTEHQVITELNSAYYMSMGQIFYNLAFLEVSDPYVKRIQERMYNSEIGTENWQASQPIFQDFLKTKFQVQSKGCRESSERNSHAMGVDKFKLGETICVSTDVLRKLPPEELHTQIVGLFAHEFAHHFGFGELDSVKFQMFIVRNLKDLKFTTGALPIKIPALNLELKKRDNNETHYFRFTFQEGRLVEGEEIDKKKPSCTLGVSQAVEVASEDSWNKKIPEPRFTIPEQTFQLHHYSFGAGTSDFQKTYAKTAITDVVYWINPRWNGHGYEPEGALARAPSKSEFGMKVTSMTCHGESLHLTDLKRVFGGVSK